MAIDPGDIIIVTTLEEVQDDFQKLHRAWRVDDISNNGKILAHDFRGKKKMLHALDRPPCYPYIVRVVKVN